MNAVRPNLAAPAGEVIGRLMKSAEAFAAGVPRHDDMTLVVVRLIS